VSIWVNINFSQDNTIVLIYRNMDYQSSDMHVGEIGHHENESLDQPTNISSGKKVTVIDVPAAEGKGRASQSKKGSSWQKGGGDDGGEGGVQEKSAGGHKKRSRATPSATDDAEMASGHKSVCLFLVFIL
jgi:hypothetical protein